LGGSEGLAHRLGIADIGVNEFESRLTQHVSQGGLITGVGELIDDRDGVSTCDEKAGQIRPDEARAASDQNTH
jgi:hypothetical protein